MGGSELPLQLGDPVFGAATHRVRGALLGTLDGHLVPAAARLFPSEVGYSLNVSIDADTGTGTGMLRVVAPAGEYSIEASLEEVTFADGSRTAVFTGDQASAPIPLRLTAHQGSAAVGLAAVMPVTGLERWAPDRPRYRSGAMQVVSGAVAVPFH